MVLLLHIPLRLYQNDTMVLVNIALIVEAWGGYRY
jgi:hypothetical protein